MHYINKFAKKGSKILDIGAGTGRYSIALAKEGYQVTALELVEHNVEIIKKNSKGLNNLEAFQGDALDLSRYEDNSFDMTIVLGPLYHLYKAATDSVFEIAERNSDFKMSDEDFQLYLKYHLNTCEKRELLGSSNHLLYVCRKVK